MYKDLGDDQYILDADADGVADDEDACPDDFTQWTDADGDGYCDEVDDKCPEDPEGWKDTDLDGVCDNRDGVKDPTQSLDADGDGYCDEVDDKCPDDNAWNDSDGWGV